ncbi:MAG TPA: hypothetical protein VGH03_15875 [Caulobacteraceae bacterium]|jgi:hypothetical protein
MDAPRADLRNVTEEQAVVSGRNPWLRFLGNWLAVTAVLLLAVGALNVAVDPFFVFGTPLIAGLNQYKPATQGREALAKAALLPRARPHTVLIGTSKVQVGLDPQSTAWVPDDAPVFNAGLPGSTSPSTLATLEDSLTVAPVRRVLVVLEPTNLIEPATPFTPAPPFLHTGWAHVRDLFDAAFTLDALEASFQTLVAQWTAFPSGLRPNGQMYDGHFRGPTLAEGPGVLFGQKAASNATAIANVARQVSAQPNAEIAQLEMVRRLIELCREKGVSVDLALAPVHADYLRLLVLAGLWPRYLHMREVLAQTVADAGDGQVRLWSFTGFNEFSTEPVPPIGQRAPALRCFWEPNHFRPEYGQLLLETIYRGRQGVGVRLEPANVGALNEAQTAAMEHDRAAQPAEWALMAQALAKVQAETAQQQGLLRTGANLAPHRKPDRI